MIERPAQPACDETIWYRGWEIGWNADAHLWLGDGWDAYKGGCDIDTPRITSSDFADCINEIDNWEDENEQ